METVTIRQATANDKKEVLGLSDNVYACRDYLPALYDHFISSPYTTPFVLLLNETIVSIIRLTSLCNV